jgi:hypothetical protein
MPAEGGDRTLADLPLPHTMENGTLRACLKSVWRLKPRLQAPSPPARTQGKSGIRETGVGRFCICSRDFSRQGYTDLDF